MNGQSIEDQTGVADKIARMKALAQLAFAQEVRRKVTAAIVPFNDCGSNSPFYCVHPVSGSVGTYRSLAEMLGPEQQFFGIQTPSRLRNPAFASSIESMSAYYVEQLIAFQPTGDFRLGGHSVGATIALEIAQQLRARGRDVSLLVVLDGEVFNTGEEFGRRHPAYWAWTIWNIPAWIRDFLIVEKFTIRTFFDTVAKKISLAFETLREKASGTKKSGHAVESFLKLDNFSTDHVSFVKALYENQYNYIPRSYGGEVLVCIAKTQSLSHLRQIRRPWKKIAPAAEFLTFSRMTHTSMIRAPEGVALADALRSRLAGSVPEDASLASALTERETDSFESADMSALALNQNAAVR